VVGGRWSSALCCARETITTPPISTSAPSSASSAGRSPARSASSALTTANAEAIGETSASVPIAKARYSSKVPARLNRPIPTTISHMSAVGAGMAGLASNSSPISTMPITWT
jgi:hypothetical protein